MVAHIQAEHLLLEGQPLGLVELEVRDRHPGAVEACLRATSGRGVLALVVKEREQGRDPLFLFAPADKCPLDDSLESQTESLARMAERVEASRLHERLDSSLVERARIDPATEVVEVDERALTLAGGDDVLDNGLPDIADRGKAEDDHLPATRGRGLGCGADRGEVRGRRIHVRHANLDPERAALGKVDGGLVLVALHRRQQCGQILDGVVRLQPRRLIRDKAVAVRVGLVEGIVGERLDDVEQPLAQCLVVTLLDTTGNEFLPLRCDQLAILLATCLSQIVGFLEGVAGEPLRDPHDRFLVEHQAVGVPEDRFHVRVEIGDGLAAVLQVRVVTVHVGCHRARPVQSDERRDVIEARRSQRSQRRAHGGTLELEHTDGVTSPQHLEGRLVVERHGVYVGTRPGRLFDEVEGHLDDREVAQPEKVHLQKAEILDTVHLVLGDDRGVARIGAGLGLALDGEVLGQRLVGDHHGGGVDAVLAAEPLEALRDVDHQLGVRVLLVHLAKLGCGHVAVLVTLDALEAGPQRGVAAHDQRRHRLRDPVAEGIGKAEDSGTVTHRGPGLDRRERDYLSHVVRAVTLGDVPDHLAAVALVEIHVYVGHLLSARVQETLEEQVIADRVEVDDAQAVGDATSCRRATTWTDADPHLPRVADDVPDDEEVSREPHLGDDAQLEIEPRGHFRRDLLAITRHSALVGQVRQIASRRLLVAVPLEGLRDRELRECRLAQLELDLRPLGYPQRVVARGRHLSEETSHLLRALQIVLLALELETLRVVDRGTGLHAQQGVMGDRVLAPAVMAVVRGDERGVDGPGDPDEARIRLPLRIEPMILQLDEEALPAEDVLKAPGKGQRGVEVLGEEGLGHHATQAPGCGNEAVVMALEQLPVHARLVVVTLEVGGRRELDEVPVALRGLGKDGQVVVEPLPALPLAAGVVDTAPPHRALETGLRGHVGLGADDRRYATLPALLVELEDAVHVAVIGDRQRGLAVRHRGGNQISDPRRPVEHRVLGVGVQMDERRATVCCAPGRLDHS